MQLRSSIVVALLLAACAPPPEPVVVIGGPAPPAPQVVAHTHEPPKGEPAAPVPTAVRPPKPQQATAPASLDSVRDPRFLAPRALPLLITEIQGLESLFASTPPASPSRPNVIRRLADAYTELEASAQQDATKATTVQAAKTVQAARRAAIKYYELLARQYTQWCASPNPSDPAKSTGCADEALYYLGLEHERADDFTNARRSYFQLVQAWPRSRLIPSAYLAFGEMFVLEAAAFSAALPRAEQSYLEVLKYTPPDNTVFGYAQHQLARVRVQSGDPKGAAAAFKKAIVWARTYPTAYSAQLEAAAQLELTKLGVP